MERPVKASLSTQNTFLESLWNLRMSRAFSSLLQKYFYQHTLFLLLPFSSLSKDNCTSLQDVWLVVWPMHVDVDVDVDEAFVTLQYTFTNISKLGIVYKSSVFKSEKNEAKSENQTASSFEVHIYSTKTGTRHTKINRTNEDRYVLRILHCRKNLVAVYTRPQHFLRDDGNVSRLDFDCARFHSSYD